MKKVKQQKDIKIICPESSKDIEDIVEMLQEKEMSILVNMSKCKVQKDAVTKIIDFILSCQKSYMTLNVKKIFPKVFVCYSNHPELYI